MSLTIEYVKTLLETQIQKSKPAYHIGDRVDNLVILAHIGWGKMSNKAPKKKTWWYLALCDCNRTEVVHQERLNQANRKGEKKRIGRCDVCALEKGFKGKIRHKTSTKRLSPYPHDNAVERVYHWGYRPEPINKYLR